MHYEGIVIRPPSEADSIILQVSVGCSYNKCGFCGAYKDIAFRPKDESEIDRDIAFAKRFCTGQNRVFLADGDALILPQANLENIFDNIRKSLPWVNRISLYANARSVRSKTNGNLLALKKKGLDRIYFGLESGDDEVLAAVRKGETAHSQEAAASRIVDAGLFLATTILLGIAGAAGSLRHARCTAELLNRIGPDQIAALSVIPLANTELGRKVKEGSTSIPPAEIIIHELRELIGNITIDRVQFMANHASNYLPLAGRLQRDKKKMLDAIDAAAAGATALVPESQRAL
ncbi:MAG: radical SAM protein [Desulfofustis sp.]|nr:radical SAM protein [Desulfofustis sp.]